jgi:hypothetical protein
VTQSPISLCFGVIHIRVSCHVANPYMVTYNPPLEAPEYYICDDSASVATQGATQVATLSEQVTVTSSRHRSIATPAPALSFVTQKVYTVWGTDLLQRSVQCTCMHGQTSKGEIYQDKTWGCHAVFGLQLGNTLKCGQASAHGCKSVVLLGEHDLKWRL